MDAATTRLKKILAYKNDEVIHRFREDHGFSLAKSRILFRETKKWLWLCSRSKAPLTMFDEIRAIDQMWHTFVLFTRDYSEFCEKYLSTFVHHVPATRKEKAEFRRLTSKRARQAKTKRLKVTFEAIYDHLGAETLKFWCERMGTK